MHPFEAPICNSDTFISLNFYCIEEHLTSCSDDAAFVRKRKKVPEGIEMPSHLFPGKMASAIIFYLHHSTCKRIFG